MDASEAQTERLGQILDYLYVPPAGGAPEEALATVLDLTADEVRVGQDVSEATLVLARRGIQLSGRFVRLVPSRDPKQLGHIVPVDVATLDHDTRRRVIELIQTGYCVQPPSDVPIGAVGDQA